MGRKGTSSPREKKEGRASGQLKRGEQKGGRRGAPFVQKRVMGEKKNGVPSFSSMER